MGKHPWLILFGMAAMAVWLLDVTGVHPLCPGDTCVSERGRDWKPPRSESRRSRSAERDEADGGGVMGRVRGMFARESRDDDDRGYGYKSGNRSSRDYWSR